MVEISTGGNGARIKVPWAVLGAVLVQTAAIVSWATVERDARLNLERDRDILMQRIESIDVNGSRGYALLVERQNNMVARSNGLDERIIGMTGRMNSISDRISETNNRITEITSRIDKLERQSK